MHMFVHVYILSMHFCYISYSISYVMYVVPPSPHDPAPPPGPPPGMGGRRDTNGAKPPRPSPLVAQKPRRDSFKRDSTGSVPATPPPPPPAHAGLFTSLSSSLFSLSLSLSLSILS